MSNNPIRSDDPQAIEKLKIKLEACRNNQEMMKAANAYYRKHGTLIGCEGFSDERAAKLVAGMEKAGASQPFPAYVISGNMQDIRRYEKRIAELEHGRDVGYVGWDFDGGSVEANREKNRLQVFFDERPPAEVAAKMKANGFKWAPSQGAWQRQLNDNAIYAAGRIEAIRPLSGESPLKLQPKAPAKDGPER